MRHFCCVQVRQNCLPFLDTVSWCTTVLVQLVIATLVSATVLMSELNEQFGTTHVCFVMHFVNLSIVCLNMFISILLHFHPEMRTNGKVKMAIHFTRTLEGITESLPRPDLVSFYMLNVVLSANILFYCCERLIAMSHIYKNKSSRNNTSKIEKANETDVIQFETSDSVNESLDDKYPISLSTNS
ncbi:MAG: hypothetical protein MHPSP_003358 [Paramarteilia canceri]